MTNRPLGIPFSLKTFRKKLPKVRLYIFSTGAQVTGLLAQFFAFVILARHLGTVQFGQLMVIAAVTNLAVQICGIGAGEAMIRRVAREPSIYSAVLGHNLILILGSGALLTLTVAVALNFFVEIDPDHVRNFIVLLIFAFSNIMLYRWISLTEYAFLGHQQFMRASTTNAGFAVWRSLATVVACVGFGVDQLGTWAVWYGLIHLAGTVACIAAVWTYGAPRWRILHEEIKLGIHLVTPSVLDALRQNVDLLALSGVETPATIGRYSAASRMVLTSLVTVNSFYLLLYPRLSVAGKGGVSTTFRLAVKYVVLATALGAATSAGLFVIAPYIALLFGKDFGNMALYIQVLCWLLILIAIKNAAFDALGAAEKHAIRATVYNISVVASVILIVGLTRIYGLPGTFAALFISHALIALALWITLFALSRRETKLNLANGPLAAPSELDRLV